MRRRGETRWGFVRLGCEVPLPADPVGEAVALARESDVAVVVVGLGPEWESEGFDRPDMRLPGDQDRLVAEVAAVQPNTVVVVQAGSPVEMPWIDDVAAVVYAWYGGQEAGAAIADVLVGNADPGGRLPVTFPKTGHQHPGMLNYPGEAGAVRYGEGIHVGYRGFDRLRMQPLFEFGSGLSYTSFALDEASVTETDGCLSVCGRIFNTGLRDGTEVVQVYAVGGFSVERKLVAYQKLRLDAGSSIDFSLDLPPDVLRSWDPVRSRWEAVMPERLLVKGTFGEAWLEIDRD